MTVGAELGGRGELRSDAAPRSAGPPGGDEPARRIRLRPGGAAYPVVLPSVRDSRLHVAGVILSIHALGQLSLGFAVSVPQIAVAIVSCGLLEMAIRLARDRVVAWPASAMLTGSGVALILRDVGTEAGDHWTLRHWWLFALVAGGSLASKYVIRWRGSHVLNPSNLGLVVAFLVLGSGRVEPLDFWWAPLGGWMALAYALIVVGGLVITRRGGLAEMAIAFWATLALLLGALALSGHCMATAWSATPVCDGHFWWVVMTSPETLIFGLFMITDPRTVPAERAGRVVFGVGVAAASALLMAPQTTEFGAKVGLLGGLVAVCAIRPAVVAAVEGRRWSGAGPQRVAAPGIVAFGAVTVAVAVVALTALAVAVVVAGAPARSPRTPQAESASPHPREIVATVEPDRLPEVTLGDDVREWFGPDIDGTVVGTELLRILDVETLALETGDPELLASVDHGRRLHQMEERIAALEGAEPAAASPTEPAWRWLELTSAHLVVVQARGQGELSLGVEASGTRIEPATGPESAVPAEPVAEPFAVTFALRPGGVDRWFLVDVVDR